MTTDAINHDPAHMFMNSGSQIAGRPSMGAWVNYGLGSEAENLPGFVVMVSTGPGRSPQPIAARQWSSGFLPTKYTGVALRGQGDPVLYVKNPPGVDPSDRRTMMDALNIAYDTEEKRGFFTLNLVSLFFTLAGLQLGILREPVNDFLLALLDLLFDLSNDISERTNLAYRHPEVVTKMRQLLADWEADLAQHQPTVLLK